MPLKKSYTYVSFSGKNTYVMKTNTLIPLLPQLAWIFCTIFFIYHTRFTYSKPVLISVIVYKHFLFVIASNSVLRLILVLFWAQCTWPHMKMEYFLNLNLMQRVRESNCSMLSMAARSFSSGASRGVLTTTSSVGWPTTRGARRINLLKKVLTFAMPSVECWAPGA